MAELHESILLAKPTAMHKFIRTLKDKGKLVRNYTQNIDGLERQEHLNCILKKKKDLKDNDVLLLHGDIHELVCMLCGHKCMHTASYRSIFRTGSAPECEECATKSKIYKNPQIVFYNIIYHIIILLYYHIIILSYYCFYKFLY